MITIHISDWNSNDRVVTLTEEVAQRLLETSVSASDRMSFIWDNAAEKSLDPRSSEMENADLFLSWPGTGAAFVGDDKWDTEHAEDLQALEEFLS